MKRKANSLLPPPTLSHLHPHLCLSVPSSMMLALLISYPKGAQTIGIILHLSFILKHVTMVGIAMSEYAGLASAGVLMVCRVIFR